MDAFLPVLPVQESDKDQQIMLRFLNPKIVLHVAMNLLEVDEK